MVGYNFIFKKYRNTNFPRPHQFCKKWSHFSLEMLKSPRLVALICETVASSSLVSPSYLWGNLGVFPTCQDHRASDSLSGLRFLSPAEELRPQMPHLMLTWLPAPAMVLCWAGSCCFLQRRSKMNKGCCRGLNWGPGAVWGPEAMPAVTPPWFLQSHLTSCLSHASNAKALFTPKWARGDPLVHRSQPLPHMCVCTHTHVHMHVSILKAMQTGIKQLNSSSNSWMANWGA